MSVSHFHFDTTTALRGALPIPPTLSADAGDLLCEMLTDAFWVCPGLRRRDHKRSCVPTARLEELCTEILRTTFPMPCAGVDEPIATVDRIAIFPTGIEFTISDLYAAYLVSTADLGKVFGERTAASPEKGALPLTLTDLPVLVSALRCQHQDLTLAWTRHAVYAANHGEVPLARNAFGVTQIETVLFKLGASIAP